MGYPRPRPEHLAAKLLRIRQALGLSQVQLAKRLNVAGINYNYVSKYERDINEAPLMVLLAYARLIGVSVDVLIDDERELEL
jgi:transcriptional regulator with XRE-family HTH domain